MGVLSNLSLNASNSPRGQRTIKTREAILMARVEEAMRNAPSNKQYDLFQQRSGGREKAKLLKNGTATVFVAIDEKLISGGYAPGPHSTKDSQWWCQCVPLPANRVPPSSDVSTALCAQICALVRHPVLPRAAHAHARG
jgi:hypothetical protein